MGNCPSAWTPATRVGDPHGALGFWLWLGPALAIVTIWGVRQQMEKLLSFCLSVFQINAYISKINQQTLLPVFGIHFEYASPKKGASNMTLIYKKVINSFT